MLDPQERERRRQRELKRRRTDRDRQAFYTSARWRRLRDLVLGRRPLCVACQAEGLVVAATCVDHVQDVRDAPHLALEPSNLQPLCRSCHNRKTRTSLNERAAACRQP